MKLIRTASNKAELSLSQAEWEKIGNEQGWLQAEAKKKGKAVNPWAVCHTTIDKKADPEKYERCVQDVKKEHKIKKT